MPEVSRFYGIIIKMYLIGSEHNPPHFHAIYGEYHGSYDFKKLTAIEGDLPGKAEKLVLEWAKQNQKELAEMWDTQNFKKLTPLV